jgi:hypothetical protein
MGRDAEGGSVARHLRRAIARDPTEGRGTPNHFGFQTSSGRSWAHRARAARSLEHDRCGFILFQHLIRTTEQELLGSQVLVVA